MNLTTRLIIAFFILAFSGAVMAEIKLEHKVEVENIVKDKNGKESIKLTSADKVVPGNVLVYSITATNTGKEAASNVVITDAISEHNTYIADSAQSSAMGKNTLITFSTDGGKIFAPPAELTVTKNGATVSAMPEDYTHVRWQLNFELAAGKSTRVMFKARLK